MELTKRQKRCKIEGVEKEKFMPKNSSKKIFEGLISKTKAYLILIAILLIVICVLDIHYLSAAILFYILVLVYTYFSNKKRKAELSEHLKT